MVVVLSLGIGWVVAGRVLRPIGRISDVARDIQATDMSRRIDLDGPDDELTRLADTFDDMLDRSIITRQVEMGVAVRMACLDVLTRRARQLPGWETPLGQGQWK